MIAARYGGRTTRRRKLELYNYGSAIRIRIIQTVKSDISGWNDRNDR
jgi:hypothetical protein